MSSPRQDFARRLALGPPVLLDGALGTELERRGARIPAPLWSAEALLENAPLILDIHTAYVLAGAEVLTACTFRTNPRTLARAKMGDRDVQLTERAVSLAREAARESTRPTWIAGSTAPVEDCYRPELVPSDFELEAEHARHAANLKAAGVDFVMIETMNTAREASIALRAARAVGLGAGVSCVLSDAQHLLSGHPLERAVAEWAELEPLYIGINCMQPTPSAMAHKLVCRLWDGPTAVYANVGRVDEDGTWRRMDDRSATQRFRGAVREWVRDGARMVGGCCGTTPSLIAALRRDLRAAAGAEEEDQG